MVCCQLTQLEYTMLIIVVRKNLENDAVFRSICTRQKVQRTIHVSLHALLRRDKLVQGLSFALTVLCPQIVRNFQNGPSRRSRFLDLHGNFLGAGLCFTAGSRHIGVGQEHLANLTGSLFGLDRLAGRISRLQDGGKHSLKGANGVFSRHGIRDVLGATFGIVHGGNDQVGNDLHVQSNRGRESKDLGVELSARFGLGGSTSKFTIGLSGSVELEDTVGILSILALLFDNVGHEFGDGLCSGVATFREGHPRSVQERTSHGGLESLQVTFGHDGLDNIDRTRVDQGFTGDGPLGQVQNDKQGKVFQAVGRPTRRRGRGGADVLNDALGNVRLANQSGVFLTLGQVLDETAGPSDTFRLARSRLGDSRAVGEELFQDTKKRIGVVQRSNSLSVRRGGVLQDSGDAGFQEGKVHQANAAQVRLLLVFGNDLAKSSNDILGGRSKRHDTLVLGRDGQVVQGQASQMTAIATLLCEALGQGSQDVVLSGADHGDTVLLVADIAKLVDSLGCGGALFSLGVEHLLDQFGNVIERGRLCRGHSLGGALVGWGKEGTTSESCTAFGNTIACVSSVKSYLLGLLLDRSLGLLGGLLLLLAAE